MSKIQVEHSAVIIEYDEYKNLWRFTVNGRQYEHDRLSTARDKIDEVIKKLKLKQRKQFDPISAFSYQHIHGRITSLVEKKKTYRSEGVEMHVRFVQDGDTTGSVWPVSSLIKDTKKNVENHEQNPRTQRCGKDSPGLIGTND